MKNRWCKLICIGLALIFLSSTALACPGGGQDGVPVVEINRVANNNLDLAGKTEAALATPGEGALVVNEAARIWVPPGAVADDTPITLKVFIETPENLASTATDGPEVAIVSNLYDLGPDNTEFSQPVTVTLSYDEEDLPTGADENNIGPVYWSGENWVPLERQIDTEKNTISFETRAFPGVVLGTAFGYAIGWGTVTASGVAIVGAGAIIGYKTYKWWIKDPVYYGKAAAYVTPNDPTVQTYADMSKVKLMGSSTKFDIKNLQNNPQAISALENAVDADGYAGFIKFFDANNVEKPMTYHVSWNPDDWQKPADFFNNGMVGDCKNVANAIGSIFRHYGFPAKCMDGYTNGARHAWLEVKIGDNMYYVGSRGELMTLDGATKYLGLTRSENKDGETFQWDESGQKPYKKNWWVDKLQVTMGNSLSFPGGQVPVEVFGSVGTALDIELTIEAPDKTKSVYTGATDAATGKLILTVPLKKDAPIGVYYATAYNKANDLSEIGIFYVDTLEIAAGMVSAQAAPGEQIGINIILNYPLEAKIVIDSINYGWMTQKDGTAALTLNVPENAKLGPYSLTVRAPDYGISTTVKYTVTIPPVMKLEIKNKEVAPGGTLEINVTILPPQVTRITIQGYDGRWMTDENGIANPQLPVSKDAQPGQYQVTVSAPELDLAGSAGYTVSLTPGINTAFNVGTVGLQLGLGGLDDEGEPWSYLYNFGGKFLVGEMIGNQFRASGEDLVNVIGGTSTIIINFNDDMTRVNGSYSFSGPEGERVYFNFSNVPRDLEQEGSGLTSFGLEGMVFYIEGSNVTDYISSFNAVDPPSGYSFTRYWADEDCMLVIMVVIADESQISDLLNM